MSEFRRRKARERLREARIAFAREDWAAAAEAFEAGLRLDTGDRDGWEQWAECLERQAKLVEAGRVLIEALEHHTDDPNLTLSLVHAEIETGQFAAAERLLERLRERWPEQRPPLAYLARVLRDIRDYSRLRTLLEHALAGPFSGDVELAGLLDACLAWQGVRVEPTPTLASMRELLLLEHGVVLLGTGHDDGVAIPWYSTYLCSNYDVVATCARLLGFASHFGWRWQAVAAIDPAAAVLAWVLGRALDVAVIDLDLEDGLAREPDPDPEATLAVASFVAPGWSAGPHGAWARRCADAGNLFAFGALDYARHGEPLPPILGLAAGERVCLPWWRLGEARLGFARFGLIEELPAEIDSRPPSRVADDYREPLAKFEHGPNLAVALRYVLDQRAHLQPGLRRRSDFGRILPHVEPREDLRQPVGDALAHGDLAEFLRALGALERAPERVGAAEIDVLSRRFVTTPEVRPRLADLLYRVAPAEFSALLHGLVANDGGGGGTGHGPAMKISPRERDTLLHLYGCNPWTGTGSDPSGATVQLRRWIELGSMTNRSEIVQSKYGLHLLAEAEDAPAIVRGLLRDEPAIAIGTIRWLHDNPHLHATHAGALLELLAHEHADVVFEALQCTRVAGIALPGELLEPILSAARHPHPRMIAAGVEHLELWPIEQAHPRLIASLRSDEPSVVWAAARSLLRGGSSADERRVGARHVAARLLELDLDLDPGGGRDVAARPILRALASVDDFDAFEVLLRASESPTFSPAHFEGGPLGRSDAALRFVKIVAAALGAAMLEHDDPRLLPHLRRFGDAFGLDPPHGYAGYLLRHGDPWVDRDAVYGAQGATDSRAGHEAKAVLARWGDMAARAELERALDYAAPSREAAFEAWYTVLHDDDWARLDAARSDADGELVARVWTVLTRNITGAHPAPPEWTAGLSAYLRESWAREAAWAKFCEVELRGQIPSKFAVGAQSADFGVLAALLPNHFRDLVERCLGGTPDRMSVDLLEWLAAHRPSEAREWAAKLGDSPHWGVRQCARRLLGPSGEPA